LAILRLAEQVATRDAAETQNSNPPPRGILVDRLLTSAAGPEADSRSGQRCLKRASWWYVSFMKRPRARRSQAHNLVIVLTFTVSAIASACTVDTGEDASGVGGTGSGAISGTGAMGGTNTTGGSGGATGGTNATGGSGGATGGSNATGGSGGTTGGTNATGGTGGSGGSNAAGTGGMLSTGGSAGTGASGGSSVTGGMGGSATGGSGGEVPNEPYCAVTESWDPAYAALEQEILVIVNQVRAQGANCGGDEMPPVGPLTMDPNLQCAARVHSKDMADRDFFDHDNPDGDGPPDRMDAAGYDGRNWGENIAAGRDTAEETMDQWMNSPGHCSNIMAEDFDVIGVGYYPGGEYGHLWTQTFGG
jgi:uncharacterized protein YkwD